MDHLEEAKRILDKWIGRPSDSRQLALAVNEAQLMVLTDIAKSLRKIANRDGAE